MPFLVGFRGQYPKIPIIIYGKALNRLDRILEAAVRIIQERVFTLDSVNPCLGCARPCSSYWPRRVVRYLLEDYEFLRVKTVREVAQHFRVTEPYLDHACNKNCILPVKQLLLALKLSAAAYLRETTTLGQEAIAVQCGFREANHLSRIFRRKVGIAFWSYPFDHPWQEVWDHFIEIYEEKPTK